MVCHTMRIGHHHTDMTRFTTPLDITVTLENRFQRVPTYTVTYANGDTQSGLTARQVRTLLC